MEIPSRRQDHSCDQCRKGKRRCDAPVGITGHPIVLTEPDWTIEKKLADKRPIPCSNCTKQRKDCTFEWLASRKEQRKRHHKKRVAMSLRPSVDSMTRIMCDPVNTDFPPLQGYVDHTSDGFVPFDDIITEMPTASIIEDSCQPSRTPESLEVQYKTPRSLRALSTSTPELSSQAPNTLRCLRKREKDSQSHSRFFPITRAQDSGSPHSHAFCALSDRTASEYARSTMTQNMIRIYHDSMENALSCWLTERNCPYNNRTPSFVNDEARTEWGPSWSNRICARICRLDQASGSIRGRALSAMEDQTAARALHLSIMAFASQWAQNDSGDGRDRNDMANLAEERSLRQSVWSQTRYVLERSTGIPSFRIIFANILFSLTQPPLSEDQDIELDELMERDRGQIFLETAVRQMFSYRYKLKQFHRSRRDLRTTAESHESSHYLQRPEATPEIEQEKIASKIPVNPIIANSQHRDTFDLLFWLGIMFDTQTAAMYQRPPVVSDEDSQMLLRTPSLLHETDGHNLGSLDLDGLDFSQNREFKGRQNLWGDMLLHSSASHRLGIGMPILPQSHEQAAEILSDAAPVKILLWRRVTQLQTLVYREAEPASLEEGVQRALVVYQHWNETYNKFIMECIAHHATLLPRIKSWYVVLAAHWHLGALILADVIESIDQAHLSLNSHRDSRKAINFVRTLRKDNASAVARLAHCSLHEQEAGQADQFHDCLSGAAFITEPFTVLLINAFTKSATFFLENLSLSRTGICCGINESYDQFHENLEFCIHALRCLGRKSDMASIVARGLSKRLRLKLESEWSRHTAFDASPLETSSTSFPTPDLPIDLPPGMDNEAWMGHFLGPMH